MFCYGRGYHVWKDLGMRLQTLASNFHSGVAFWLYLVQWFSQNIVTRQLLSEQRATEELPYFLNLVPQLINISLIDIKEGPFIWKRDAPLMGQLLSQEFCWLQLNVLQFFVTFCYCLRSCSFCFLLFVLKPRQVLARFAGQLTSI